MGSSMLSAMESLEISPTERRVGLLYDERMCRHSTPDGEEHPECPERIKAIWRSVESAGITKRCVVLEATKADEKWLSSVHSKKHVELVKRIGTAAYDNRKRRNLASGFNSIYLNDGSSESAFLAAGSVVQVAEKVASGELNSALALVRPPGHHAEHDQMMGFCIFNNVAVAASYLLNERPELGIRKILIVDWDVHHGNGTQKMFYNDPRVLFFSVHRFDFGSFYPSGGDGAHFMTGEDLGAGYNINVPWEHGRVGDADYLAVWEYILIPVAEAYNPDIILISGGFDAAIGDPLGGCRITPYGYSMMLFKLMRLAHGRIVMALEGGYNLNSIAKSVLACAETLLDSKSIDGSIEDPIFASTLRVIQQVRLELESYWPVLAAQLPQKIFSNSRKIQLELSSSSESETEEKEEAISSTENTTLEPRSSDFELSISNLSIQEVQEKDTFSRSAMSLEAQQSSNERLPLAKPVDGWRALLSMIDVWYGSYGSNMWTARFLCYIRGGKVEGMVDACTGSRDTNLPKDNMWTTVPHSLFFGRSYTKRWGAGGVAFLNPETNPHSKAYICLYKITLEQFNDLLLQENGLVQELASPLLDATDLEFIVESKSLSLNTLGGWYSNVLYLGSDGGTPMLTMTCPQENVDGFRTGALPMLRPSREYANTLIKGLVEGKQLSETDAVNYVNNASLDNC